MSQPITISDFNGIAPRYGANLQKGFAVTARNCDLSSGKIRPLADAGLQEADTTKYNSLFYQNGWFLGTNRHYLEWKIGDYDLLIYLDGVPMKRIGGFSAALGQDRLTAPTVALNGSGVLNDTFRYIITTTRSVGGYTDESGPSDTSAEIVAANNTIRITRPAISDSHVTFWNIYRMSNSSGEYQFLAEISSGTSYYDDNIADADLGASPTTWYTSDQGNMIVWGKPQVTFDGLITDPHSGMIFGWKGPTLYWNEPGYPDAWPSFYNMNFPSNIKRVFSLAGTVAVLLETGAHRVDGTHPELLQPSKALSNEPCIGASACLTSKGVAYLSDSGISLFNLVDTTVISDSAFTEQWFKDNIDAASAFMIENDRQLYLFHSAGVLVVDMRARPYLWYTLDIVAYAAHVRKDTGELYYIDDEGIQLLHGGASSLTWTWRSGDIVGAHVGDKSFEAVLVNGAGTVQLTIFLDGIQAGSKALNFLSGMDRDRILKCNVPKLSRAMQVELTGTGEVDEIIIGYSP